MYHSHLRHQDFVMISSTLSWVTREYVWGPAGICSCLRVHLGWWRWLYSHRQGDICSRWIFSFQIVRIQWKSYNETKLQRTVSTVYYRDTVLLRQQGMLQLTQWLLTLYDSVSPMYLLGKLHIVTNLIPNLPERSKDPKLNWHLVHQHTDDKIRTLRYATDKSSIVPSSV